MKDFKLLIASMVLTCFAVFPVTALADEDLDVTMDVIDNLSQVEGVILEMSAAKGGDEHDGEESDGDYDGEEGDGEHDGQEGDGEHDGEEGGDYDDGEDGFEHDDEGETDHDVTYEEDGHDEGDDVDTDEPHEEENDGMDGERAGGDDVASDGEGDPGTDG